MTPARFAIAPERYRQVCIWALASLVLIVATGAAVRLTGSGLGCSDWPTCEEDRLVASWSWHPMIEFVNRLITGVVSVGVIAAVAGAWWRVPRRADLCWYSLGLVAGVVGQILLGAALVKAELDPRFTIGHFLLSAVLVANAVVLHHRAGLDDDRRPRPAAATAAPPADPRGARAARLALASTVAIGVTVVLGTIVTGAGPHGGDDRAARFNLEIAAVTRLHSGAAWVAAASILLLALHVGRDERAAAHRRPVWRLLALTIAQGGLGYLQYALGIPALLVGFHVLGATVLWALSVRTTLELREARTAPAPAVSRPEHPAEPVLSGG